MACITFLLLFDPFLARHLLLRRGLRFLSVTEQFARLLMVDTAIVDHLPPIYEQALHALFGDGLPPPAQDDPEQKQISN